jgi:tryptophan synthase alpha chain
LIFIASQVISFEAVQNNILMNRLEELFQHKKNNVLSVYCTAGFPQFESTLPVLKALQDNGADMIELGMPYSDPLADGPVIQASGSKALENGVTMEKLFAQLQDCRKEVYVPIILMGYMNPVLQYGFERFCKHAAAIPIDGLILPDLPEYEFEAEYAAIIRRYGLDFIFMITPETSEERIRKLDELSTGFLYAVSSSSTTGNTKDFSEVEKYLQRLQHLQLKNPVIVGFGIKDKQSFASACKYANGAIIGTAYIKAIENVTDIEAGTKEFLQSITS